MSETAAGDAPQQAGGLRSVVRGFLALSVATAIGQLIGFAVLVLVARRAGPEALGAYTFAFSFAAYFEIPIDFGVTMYAIREVARRPERVKEIVGEVVLIQTVLLVLCLVVTLALAPALLPSESARELLPIILAGWIPTALSLDWAMRALQQMTGVALWRLAGQVVYGALAPILIGTGFAGIKTYAWLNVVGSAVTAIGISIMLLRRHGVKFNGVRLKGIGRRYANGAIVGVSLAIVMVYFQAGSLILGYLKDDTAVGLYSVAYKIPMNIVLIGTIWLQAAYPYASARILQAPQEYLGQLGRVVSASVVFALPIAVGATVLASELMVGLFGDQYADAALPFALLTWSSAIALIQVHFTNSVLALGEDRRYLVIVIAAGVVSIGLGFALVPAFGPSGAAVATIAAECTLVGAMIVRVRRSLGTPRLDLARIRGAVLASAAMAGALLLVRPHVSVWAAVVVGVVVYAAGALLLGAVRREELRALARRGG